MSAHIHITGASGCGVTTLGAALAERLGVAHLDTDSFYWLQTDPPFTDKRPVEGRLAMMEQAFSAAPEGWVLSGSVGDWADPLVARFDLVVFLQVPTEIRMARILSRERERYGAAIEPGGAMHAASQDFLDWCAGYDTGERTGRSLSRHLSWLERLACPVLKLDGTATTTALAEQVITALPAETER